MRIRNILAVFIILTGCSGEKEELREREIISDFPDAVAYEIFVQSFCDSNGDGIGDLQGLNSKIPYLVDLGVKTIWLMPVHPSPSYHKYDITDYYSIHPDYGTLQDFREFLTEAHKNGLKVLLDLVINHTSDRHPWFLDAQLGADHPYREYYIWASDEEIGSESGLPDFSETNQQRWHALAGDFEKYYGFFSEKMPDLNLENEVVRNEMFKVGRFWLQEIGVDGFRLEAAQHLYPDFQSSENYNFWQEFRKEMIKVKPDVYLVGEIRGSASEVAPYLTGMDAAFNFELQHEMINAVASGNPSGLLQAIQSIRRKYHQVNPEFKDAIFLSNHDQERVASTFAEDSLKLKLAASLLFTFPGTPFIYYGEELGMPGSKPKQFIREPFLWNDSSSDSSRTTWIEPKYSRDGALNPLAEQQKDQGSMFSFYRNWIHYRNRSQPLTYGEIKEKEYTEAGLLCFQRFVPGDTVLVLHNFNNFPVEYKYNSGRYPWLFDPRTDKESKRKEDLLVIEPGKSLVLSQ